MQLGANKAAPKRSLLVIVLASMVSGSYASCFYESIESRCIFLDDQATTCYTCSPDTDFVTNEISANTDIVKHQGPCGCALEIKTSCVTMASIIPAYVECNRNGVEMATAIYNNEPCGNCTAKDNAAHPSVAPVHFMTTFFCALFVSMVTIPAFIYRYI